MQDSSSIRNRFQAWGRLSLMLLVLGAATSCNMPGEKNFLGFSKIACVAPELAEFAYGNPSVVAQLPDTPMNEQGVITSPAEGVFPKPLNEVQTWVSLTVSIPRNAVIADVRAYLKNAPAGPENLEMGSSDFQICQLGSNSTPIPFSAVSEKKTRVSGTEQVITVKFASWSPRNQRSARLEVDWRTPDEEAARAKEGPVSPGFSTEGNGHGRAREDFPAAF